MNTEQAKHTKGPWISRWRGEQMYGGNIEKPSTSYVAEVHFSIGVEPEEAKANLALMAAAPTLLEFAKLNHDTCGDCDGTGKIYNNADPTSGQWVPCPYAEAIALTEGNR
jgi:hypothetical protein